MSERSPTWSRGFVERPDHRGEDANPAGCYRGMSSRRRWVEPLKRLNHWTNVFPFHAMWQPRLFLPTQPQLSPSKRARDKFRVMSFICKARRAVECVCVWLEWLMAWLEGPLRYVTIKTIMFHLPVSSQKIVGRKKKTCTLNHSVVGSTNTLWLYWGDCSLYLMCFSDHFWPPFIWKQISVLCDSQIWLVMMAFRL